MIRRHSWGSNPPSSYACHDKPVKGVGDRNGDGSSTIWLVRSPIMPMLASVGDAKSSYIVFFPFKSPLEGHQTLQSSESKFRTLGARIRRYSTPLSTLGTNTDIIDLKGETHGDSENIIPLVLWSSDHQVAGVADLPPHSIVVDMSLTRHLRQHQREGVQFTFNCLVGLNKVSRASCLGIPVTGCILADDMGLGKTLQSITVLWTLLHQGFHRLPTVRKALIICPASLVKNWASEIEKWLQGKCKCTPVIETSREKVVSTYEGFKYDRVSRVLITSYEPLRLHGGCLMECPIDLVICDEAHRLKNERTKIVAALYNLPTNRRLLLSGTPIQNDLEEFFALASLCLPDTVLGDSSQFRKEFINPILAGREPDATEKEQVVLMDRLKELSQITNQFILRRTNVILARLLPPKTVFAIFCRLSESQKILYEKILKDTKQLTMGLQKKQQMSVGKNVLSSIQTLMKVCNHPDLVPSYSYNDVLPTPLTTVSHQRQRISTSEHHRCKRPVDVKQSGKLLFLASLLLAIKTIPKTNECIPIDKIVIISNFTQTLDLIERLLKDLGLSSMRLDGATSIKRRHDLVTTFNDPVNPIFAFLLSSKAGGCGINLIGANRLVMFDPDWNPANDKQALARIWREGQKKDCFIYRLFSTGTLEEKIFRRQLRKDSLSSIIVSTDPPSGGLELGNDVGKIDDHSINLEDIAELFTLNLETMCETHDLLSCTSCTSTGQSSDITVNEADLTTWAHHPSGQCISDPITAEAFRLARDPADSSSVVTFAMSAHIHFATTPQ